MKRGRRWLRLRTTGLPLAVGMVALLGGGSPARMAPPPGVGIDPLEVLDQQVKHNVLIVLDTSRTMKAPFDRGSFSVGGDDPASRFYQVKQALKAAVTANQARANIGLATFNVLDADKTVNRTQDLEGDTRADGPFIYVSADAGAAGFFTNQLCAATGSSDGFFCNVSDVFDDYNDPVSAEIFRSFSNVGGPNQLAAYDPYPAGCTPGTGQLAPVLSGNTPAMRCRYYMQSRLLRNGMRYIWDRAAGPAGGTETPIVGGCPAPPAGLLSHPGTPACFQLQDGSLTGAVSTFYYSSAIFQDNTASPCAAGAVMAETDNGSCTGNAPATLARLELELPLADIPPLPGNATFTYGPPGGHLDGDQTIVRGLRADQDGLPIKATLDFIHTTGSPVFPGQADPAQRNFVILVTAGDESCANPDPDLAAVAAADAAENLLNGDPTDFRRTATTIVVGIGGNASPPRLDAIAQGGSGAFIDGSASGPGTAVTGCRTGAPCFNALMAQDTRQLTTAIDAALERAGATGIFSATQSVFDGVFEYVRTVDPSPNPSPFNPLDPESRYQASAFRSYRASFNGSSFDGFVRAFDQAGPVPTWEAGQKLLDRITPHLFTTDHTFDALLTDDGGPNVPTTPYDQPADTHIDRRIFTTTQNGRSLVANRVYLWGVNLRTNGVAPSGTTGGSLDTRLFRKPDGSQMSQAELQAPPLKACMGTFPATHLCATSLLAATKREAREMILAYTAGAEAQRDALGNPRRNAAGDIVYRARRWILAESTVGTPALVSPPLQTPPTTIGTNEYILYRDGPRLPSQQNSRSDDGDIALNGYGLRNPDRDGREAPRGALNRPLLKPVMSILYVPANDMLHAFRAGPCPVAPFGPSSGSFHCVLNGAPETGGEELWAYVPHDLLPKLKDRMLPQTRTSHTYMLAASLRFADVFVPSARFEVQGVRYFGRWRRVLLFGRGIGGKYYSALDITGVGAFTRHSLGTRLPTVLWNRGNPDTVDGLTTGTRVGTATDLAFYAKMGQTWSTPAVGQFITPGTFRAVVGSGYGTVASEGTQFYVMNPMNGDIVDTDASLDVGDNLSQLAFQNALVANPVVYSPSLLVAGIDLPHPSSPINNAAYIGDIHGRIWKYTPTLPAPRMQRFRDLGIDQPIGVAAALLNLGSPFVFVNTGADARVAPPADGFKMFGFKDTGPPYPAGVVITPVGPPDFSIDFPSAPTGKGEYRGTLQPVTAFRGSTTAGTGVVFFTGTRFNPPAGPCQASTFDTIIFGAVGSTGGTAYATAEFEGVKAVGVPRPPLVTTPGVAPVDHGTPQPGQEPEAAQVPANKVGGASSVTTKLFRPGSAVCR